MAVGACLQAGSARSGAAGVTHPFKPPELSALKPKLTPSALRRLPLRALNGRAVGSRFSFVAKPRGPDAMSAGPWGFSN